MSQADSHLPNWLTIRRVSAWTAMCGALLCAVGWWMSPAVFYQSYLLAFLTVSSTSLGCAAVLMIHHLVGGQWGRAARPILEAGAWPLLMTPLAAIPFLAGIDALYMWARPDAMAHNHHLADKAAYLNEPFFLARAAVYLVTWTVLASLLCGWWRSANVAGHEAERRSRRLKAVSGIGLLVYAVTASFAAIDWMMSLEPAWFSAVYGVTAIAGQGVAAFALVIVVLARLSSEESMRTSVPAGALRDLANLLLAAVVFWMYITFSEFLIIWSGNLPEEIAWYLARGSPAWKSLAAALVLLHFLLPFVLLLSPRVKGNARWLGGIGSLLLVMHVVDLYWRIMPPLRGQVGVYWLDITCLATLVAVWMTAVLWHLQRTGLPDSWRIDEVRVAHESRDVVIESS